MQDWLPKWKAAGLQMEPQTRPTQLYLIAPDEVRVEILILVLTPPFAGLSSIVNVLNRVGPTETNNSDDVKVIQSLLRMIKGNFGKKVGLPTITGNYDAVTGFWIYDTQYFMKTKKGHPGVIVDGVVSPARGSVYSAGAPWTIVLFNHFAQQDSPTEYAAFVGKASSGSI